MTTSTVDLKYELLDRIGVQYDAWCDDEMDEQEMFTAIRNILDEITTRQKNREFEYFMERLLQEEENDV